MFSTSLRQRPDLPGIVPLLTSSTTFNLRETTLQTHDLALPIRSSPSQPNNQHQQHPQPTHQFFLILTPTSLQSPDILERITRFSTLAASPAPTIAFILSAAAKAGTGDNSGAGDGVRGYMQLQTLTHTLPTPPAIIPIPCLTYLLPLLKTYTDPTTPTTPPIPAAPIPTPTPTPTLTLLPHLTASAPARPLSTHDANVLSDLCHSLKEVVEMAGSERGSEVLVEWFGEREARGLREFWEGEWIVE